MKIVEVQSETVKVGDLKSGDWFVDNGRLGRVEYRSNCEMVVNFIDNDKNKDVYIGVGVPVIPVDVEILWKRIGGES